MSFSKGYMIIGNSEKIPAEIESVDIDKKDMIYFGQESHEWELNKEAYINFILALVKQNIHKKNMRQIYHEHSKKIK